MTLSVPQSPVLQGAIGGFIPQLVVRPAPLTEDERSSAGSPEALSLRGFVIGQDYNLNGLPDPETALRVVASQLEPAEREDGPELGWRAQAPSYPLIVRDAGGAKVGQLTLIDAVITLEASPTVGLADTTTPPTALWLAGDVSPDEITVLITSFAGIEAEALAQLIKSVWGLPPAPPLPETLPLLVRVTLAAQE